MKYSKTIIFLAILAVLAPSVSLASSVVRTGETISIEKDQKIEGDFYAASSVLSISGEVAEDLVSIAGRNTLNGKVGKDALMLGVSVDVHGAVGEDLRIIAGDVVIAEPITGDVFIIADTVKILSTASIGGDLIVYGGTVEVSGSVGGNIIGSYESLRLDAPVAKAVDVSTKQLILGDRAEITGHVRYVSSEELVRAPSAKIGGEVTRNDAAKETEEKASVRHLAIAGLIVLFSVLAWFMVARSLLVRVVERAVTRSIRPFLLGFITLIAAPVIFVVLTISIIGSLVGISGLLVYLVVLITSFVGMTAVMGECILSQTKKKKSLAVEVTPYSLVVGAIAVTLLVAIPFIGPIVLLGAFLVTVGAIVDLILRPTIK
jgi:cytoskeletal protein CcmA (bactofilin family)